MANGRNPILEMLNKQSIPASVPQSTVAPSGASPLGMGLTGAVAAPQMPMQAPAAPATTSLDLPAGLQSLIGGAPPMVNEAALQTIPTGTVASNPQFPALDFRMQPTYAQGGMVGMDGQPDMTGAAGMKPGAGGGRMSQAVMEQNINDMMRKNPQMVQQIQNTIQAGLQSGELTQQELNMAVQLATVALQNPEMYPYVRNFAIQQGLADEQSLSPQYDEGLLFVILLAARIAQQSMGGQNMIQGGSPAMAGNQPQMAMANGGQVSDGTQGGKVVGPGHDTSDNITIAVSPGEYVIPAKIVKMKGKEFFDSLLDKYKDT
jgi:hypothetical protein